MSESPDTEYTPTTAEIREYVEVGGEPRPWEPVTEESDALDARRAAAFDRWLAAHDREVAAKALEDAANDEARRKYLYDRAARIREEDTK